MNGFRPVGDQAPVMYLCAWCRKVLTRNPRNCKEDQAISAIEETRTLGVIWLFCNWDCNQAFQKRYLNNPLASYRDMGAAVKAAYPARLKKDISTRLLKPSADEDPEKSHKNGVWK